MTFALVAASHTFAMAGACGDDIRGKRVACRCGDTVVSDTVLWAVDPVVSEPCSGDGLVLLAPPESGDLTLSLGGQSIVGVGRGTGIRVVRGGRIGWTIVGGDEDDTRAEVAGFATGIRVSGRDALREVRAVDVHHNRSDGLKIRASGANVDDVRTRANGRHGVAVSGHGNMLSRVESHDNVGNGVEIGGSNTMVGGDASGNLRNGVVIGGRGNRIDGVRSTHNAAAGVVVSGSDHDVVGIDASDNAGPDTRQRARSAR